MLVLSWTESRSNALALTSLLLVAYVLSRPNLYTLIYDLVIVRVKMMRVYINLLENFKSISN